MGLDTAVIPCGGLARRLRPVSYWVPKEMLPVGLKPLLYWALDEVADAGLLHAILVVNPHKPIVEAAARQYQGPLELEFVPQPAFHGLGDAIWCAREALAGSPFVVVQPDHLFDGANGTALVAAAHRTSARAAALLSEVTSSSAGMIAALGRATIDGLDHAVGRVTALSPRGPSQARYDLGGAQRQLAPFGRVAYPGSVFTEFEAIRAGLAQGAELDDRPVLQRLVARGELSGVVTSARAYDAGIPEGYREAVAHWPARV